MEQNYFNGYYNMDVNQMQMPPYMGNNCMETYENIPNCYQMKDYNMCNMYKRCDNYMNPYMTHNMEPLENMCGKTYKILIVYVKKTVQKIVVENMGRMPKSISKERFNKHMNELVCEVMKKEEEIKKLVVTNREQNETVNDDRSFCPYCGGMLKDTLAILLVTELIKGGCKNCHE